MTRVLRILLVASLAAAASETHAFAQPGVLVFGTFGSRLFTAKNTFKAVTGKEQQTLIAGGIEATDIWRHLFVDAAFSQLKIDGQRVVVSGSDVFPLGIPLKITIRPIDVGVGWRMQMGRVMPYFGGGGTYVTYKETSDFADPGDNVDERRGGGLAFGGVEFQIVRWIRAGGEVRFRSITGILGKGGASQAFNEKDLGGLDFGVRVSVGR